MRFNDLVEQEMNVTAPIIMNYPWEDKNCYGMWLAQTYYMVAHSTRLVGLAGAYCALDQNDLHARFIDHSKEERGHEKICISDINALGKKLSDFPKLAQSQSMYQIQYYWIQHVNPVSFFGYTFSLEMLAVNFGQKVYEKVRDVHGESAAKFLKIHSADDVDHVEKAFQMINKLNPDQLRWASENLLISTQLYRQMLLEAPVVVRSSKYEKLTA